MMEQPATASFEKTLTQTDFDAFAALSGDDNPIHVDPEFSSRTRFGRTVSHGMLLYSILRGLIDRLAPGARQLTQELKFPAPAFANESIAFEAKVIAQTENHIEISVVATRLSDGAVVCEGSCRVGALRED